ncbi:MAG: sugar phosphate nucleotidyltransferase, partial [Clostridia bacterium]|nr:sugar phosphate nucleotidyltransferase [Clostridia bacterium]
MHELSVVILAAGEGKRMKSKNSKVVFPVCQKPIINWVLDAALGAGATFATVVVGHMEDQVRAAVGDKATFVTQHEQLGTAHAVMQARSTIENSSHVLVLAGDTPLIEAQTLKAAYDEHIKCDNDMTVITTILRDPAGYGRIVRNLTGEIDRIVEEKDATETQRKISEINSGMYCFRSSALLAALEKVDNNNAQGEYYLTDVLSLLRSEGRRVGAHIAPDCEEISGVNNRVQLASADLQMRRRINSRHMLCGVTIMNTDDTYIAPEVEIGRDTVIYPGAILSGNTKIGEDVVIGPSCRLVNAVIEDGADIFYSTVLDSSIKKNTHVGPYA